MRFSLFLLFLFLIPSVLATGIGNVPERWERDFVIKPGLVTSYSFPVYGAEQIDVVVGVPSEIGEYVQLIDPAPKGGPRTIEIHVKFPKDISDIPPGIYVMGLAANEVPIVDNQVSTAVSITVTFTYRMYSQEPYMEITDLYVPPTPQGGMSNFTATLTSRTFVDIPPVDVVVTVDGTDVRGSGRSPTLIATEHTSAKGALDTRELPGGIYTVRASAPYAGGVATAVTTLRIGTLTIDVADYSKSLTYNETNKFTFRLRSNWNKPLTNVLATVDLVGQTKRAAPEEITPFGETGDMEVYFDRSEQPPGKVEGTITVRYQELAASPDKQKDQVEHEFRIPIAVDIVIPPEPVEADVPFEFTLVHGIILAAALLILLNLVILFMVFRRKPKQEPPKQESSKQEPPKGVAP